MITSPASMSDAVCELSEAALLRRLGDSPADAVAVENSRVTKRWIDLRARLYSENQSLQIEQVERWAVKRSGNSGIAIRLDSCGRC